MVSVNPLGISAQTVSGNIIGTVTDPSGAAVPNASIVVTDVSKGTSQTVQSNASGNYIVSRLIPDVYTVKASAQGFSAAEADNVSVSAGSSPQVNLVFQAAGTSQTVTVTGAASALQTDSADVSNVIGSRQLQDLPNQNRNFTTFALLTPGVQRGSYNTAPTENPQGTQSLEVNGSNYGSLGYLLDGTDNREPIDGIIVVNPTLDSVSESKVDTENFPAEFGGAIGGMVSAQTRSGSNALHGDVFFFRRSADLEARDPFTQSQPDAVTGKYIPDALYSQFGGSVGGPLLKDKAFFFGDYQGTRQKIGTSLQQNVPTMTVRNTCLNSGSATCDLSQYGGGVFTKGATGAPTLTPQGIALLRSLPTPNAGTGATNNYVGSGNGNDNGDQADVRFDDQVTKDLHAFARYDYSRFTLYGAPVFGAAGGTGFGLGNTTGTDLVQNQSAAAGFDYAINSSLLTDFRFGFLDYHVSENKIDAGTLPATTAGIANLDTNLLGANGSPTYDVSDGSISNFGNQGCNCPLLESEQVFQVNNNWTKTFGNHSIRFGGDLRYAMNLRNASDYNRAGELTFSNSTNTGTQAGGQSGLGLLSVLTGQIAQFQRFDVYNQNAANRQKRGAFYGQDTWRVTPKLTLNYGARYDIIFPETVNSPGNGGFTDLANGVIRVAGVGGIGTNGNENVDLLNLAGRFGFAYQIHDGTVIRGAIGQVYDDVGFYGTIFGSALTHNIPVVNAENVGSTSNGTAVYSYATLPAQAAQLSIPANGLIPIQNGFGYNVRPKTLLLPKVDQFNLSIQQQVTQAMTFTVGYVGNIGERVYPGETEGYNVNAPVLPTTSAQLANRDARRPYYGKFPNSANVCCSQDINSVKPAARETYHAFQATVEQRFAHGFQLLANYTWSHAQNYGSTYFNNNPSVEKGPSDTNRNQLFVLSGLYELPFGKDKRFGNTGNRLVNYAIGGWQLAGTTTWESGLPFTPTYAECGSDQDIDTNSGSPNTSSDCRPDKTIAGADQAFVKSASSYDATTRSHRIFTPVAALTANGQKSGPFVRPQFGTIGNIGRNSFRGPSDYFADASLFKNFSITERVKGQFQFQAFNVFNHVPLGVPSATNARCVDCSTGDAGLITSVDSAVANSGQPYMRQLQFGGKITF